MTFSLLSIWILTAIALLIGEIVTGGFFLFFLSLGCFAAALFAYFELPLLWQGISAATVSVLGVFLLRKPIHRRLLHSKDFQVDVGKEIVVDQRIPPEAQQAAPAAIYQSYQGTSWAVANVGSEELLPGDRAIIVGVNGNILQLRKK